ncbi:MAG: sugar ABC transporter permease [Clostridia bacterium]|nr:sugar ABC transporter permease [Clostridia bacterium]MBR5383865.1 sugar ABC transporter permease [Clostridia bacterium]
MVKKRRRARKGSYMTRKQNRLGYFFMSPWILGFLVFTLFPFLMTIYLSFCSVSSTIKGYEISFIGLDNYYTAFFRNTEFVPALLSFLSMVVPYTFIIIVVSFILAYLLNKIKTGRTIMRIIYFLPIIILSGPVMSQILDSADEAITLSQGVSEVYKSIWIFRILYSYSPTFTLFLEEIFDQLSMILWFTGIPIVLFISTLQRINHSLYEAAYIDGANEWQVLWKVTVPMAKPTALVASIFTIVQLGSYDTSDIYGLIKAATNNTATGLGYAATYAWLYGIMVLLVIGAAFLIFRERKPKAVVL